MNKEFTDKIREPKIKEGEEKKFKKVSRCTYPQVSK
jgi:hypothetical protein